MDANAFYDRVLAAMATQPDDRHRQLLDLHDQALQNYRKVLRQLTPEQVIQQPGNQSDQRTIFQIVGHMAAWDRFAVLAAGDILAGVRHPHMITDMSGYREQDGTTVNFATIHEFNAYHQEKYSSLSWPEMQYFAEDIAKTLYTMFSHPQLLSATRLEQTAPFWKRLQNDKRIENITMGWNLWVTMIEHLAVEHAALVDYSGNS